MGYDVWRVLLGEGLLANALNFSEPEAGSAFLKKEKKSSFKRKKAQKNPLLGIPPGALRGNFRGAKKCLRHVCAP